MSNINTHFGNELNDQADALEEMTPAGWYDHLRKAADYLNEVHETLGHMANVLDTVLLHNKPMSPADLKSRRELLTRAEVLLATNPVPAQPVIVK